MTVNIIDLDSLYLASGAHEEPEPGTTDWVDAGGACVMEAVAFVAGEPWSDHPECASKVIGAFLRTWNDALPDDDRQQLKQYIPRLVGSAGTPEQEDERAWLAIDWLVRTYTPTWLRFAAETAPEYAEGLSAHADRLAALPEFRAGMDVPSVRPVIDAARADSAAAGAAAGAAAWDAAGAAAWDAAWDAARDAAWAAAGDAARAAAWDAAWDAARAAAGAAAWDAARDAAGAAAWDAARDAAGAAAWDAARAAAWDAAWDALRAHVEQLQADAHRLVERMLAVGGTGE